MGEIRQTNFRIDQETADLFRKFCDENGLSQAQGFDHVMQVLELDRAKAAVPSRITEIEGFEQHIKAVMSAFLYSIEVNQNAESRIREQFASDLVRKDKTIDDLRAKVEKYRIEKEAAEAARTEAVKIKEQAEKDTAAAEKVRVAAEKTAEDKRIIADTLAAKLAEAEKKAKGYDKLEAAYQTSREAVKAAEQQVKDARRDAAEAAKDAAREAEKSRDKAVQEAVTPLLERITALRDELRISKNEAEAARREAETAKAAAIAELSQAHRTEVAGIREKLDARTEDLLQTKQHLAEIQIQLQKEQSRAAELEYRLAEALKNSEAL